MFWLVFKGMHINLLQLSHAQDVAKEHHETYFISRQPSSNGHVDESEVDRFLDFADQVVCWCGDERSLFKIGPYALTPASIAGLITGMAPVVAILYTSVQSNASDDN